MDSCLLCLELYKDVLDSIKINSKQWQTLNITSILEKHLWPLNTIQSSSWICLSCWQRVDDFNKFYLLIEEAHMTFGNIKIEEETEFLASNEKLPITNGEHEPEIVIDQGKQHENSAREEQLNSRKTSTDPLEKIKCIKVNIRKNTERKPSQDTKSMRDERDIVEIKIEPEVSSDNNEYTDDETDNEKFTNNNNKTKATSCKKGDKFISEHIKELICDLCATSLENFTVLKKHFINMHNQKGYLSCCNRKFYQRNHFIDHLNFHLNPDYFKCTQCAKVLSDRKNFKSHMLRVHRPKDVVLRHSCEICGKSFTQGYVLRTHKLTHLPKEEKKFPCPQCGKFYSSSNLLKLHNEVVHLKKHAKVCYICGKTLSTSTEYKAHMNKHEGIPAPVINCDVCGLRLISERSLKLHKESQHPIGGKKDHPCHVCHKISPTVRALKKHIQTMHEKGCEHKCPICEKTFRRAETLKEHMASHMGTPLYKCLWCPKTFNSNGNMHAHRKNVHPKESLELKLQKYSKNIKTKIT